MALETVTFELPTHWASALVNSDESGLDEFDCEALEAFTEWMLEEHGQCWCIGVEEDSFFEWHHDAIPFNALPGDVSVFTFDISSEANDGQPSEMQEWQDFDRDC